MRCISVDGFWNLHWKRGLRSGAYLERRGSGILVWALLLLTAPAATSVALWPSGVSQETQPVSVHPCLWGSPCWPPARSSLRHLATLSCRVTDV